MFSRDDSRALDLSYGSYSEPCTCAHAKHTHEVRFCVGAGMKWNSDGTESVHRLPLLENTSKRVVSMQDFYGMVQGEVLRVKILPGNCKPWVSSTRPLDTIYHMDPITLPEGVGNVTAIRLSSSSMLAIGDLLHITHPPSAASLKLWSKFFQQASSAMSTPTPASIDHRKADNPH